MTDPRNRKQYGGAKPHRAQKSSARTGVAGSGLLHGRPGQFGKVGRHDGRIAAAGLEFGNRAVDRLQDFSLPGMILGHRGVQPADGAQPLRNLQRLGQLQPFDGEPCLRFD